MIAIGLLIFRFPDSESLPVPHIIFFYLAGGFLGGMAVALILSIFHKASFNNEKGELISVVPIGYNEENDYIFTVTYKDTKGETKKIPMCVGQSSVKLYLGPVRKIITLALKMTITEGEPCIERITEDAKNSSRWVIHPFTSDEFKISLPKSAIDNGYSFSMYAPAA